MLTNFSDPTDLARPYFANLHLARATSLVHPKLPPLTASAIILASTEPRDCGPQLAQSFGEGSPATNHQFTLSFGEGSPSFSGVANNGHARQLD
jgi:hypothetical protein